MGTRTLCKRLCLCPLIWILISIFIRFHFGIYNMKEKKQNVRINWQCSSSLNVVLKLAGQHLKSKQTHSAVSIVSVYECEFVLLCIWIKLIIELIESWFCDLHLLAYTRWQRRAHETSRLSDLEYDNCRGRDNVPKSHKRTKSMRECMSVCVF